MCAFLSQPMNQFAQASILGLVELVPSPNVINAQILPTSVATAIQVGSAVKLVDGTAGAILVDVCTGPTDGPVYGYIGYNDRKNVYVAGDFVEVCAELSVVTMKTSAAVARGALVASTAATTSADPTVATAVSTNYVGGVSLDKATAANQLIRVQVKPSADVLA
jgi:hypothetical protein